MSKKTLLYVALSTVAFGAISSTAPVRPGSNVPVPLTVTVHAVVDEALNPCRICGDGVLDGEVQDTEYVDGEDGVKASIDQYGNLIIDFNTTRTPMRRLTYDYSLPLDGQTTVPAGGSSGHYFSTVGLGGGPLQAMASGDSIVVASCPLYNDDSGQPQYRHAFSRDCQSGFGVAGSAPLRVTRTAEEMWVIQPDWPEATSRVFGITTKGKVALTPYGHFSLPFKMTLTAKR